jgi:hypothetical protein
MGGSKGHKIVNASKTHKAGLSMQFGTGVKTGTYETCSAENQDFATTVIHLVYIA